MVDVHGLAVVDMAARAQRVRADGFTADNDVCLAYCAPTLKRTCRGDCRALVPVRGRRAGANSPKYGKRAEKRTGPSVPSVDRAGQHDGAAARRLGPPSAETRPS